MENALEVNASPDLVYSFLLDVNQVVACVPGTELVDQVDPHTFKGKVKIKVGPVTVAYDGLARIAERDDAMRTAILEAEGTPEVYLRLGLANHLLCRDLGDRTA